MFLLPLLPISREGSWGGLGKADALSLYALHLHRFPKILFSENFISSANTVTINKMRRFLNAVSHNGS